MGKILPIYVEDKTSSELLTVSPRTHSKIALNQTHWILRIENGVKNGVKNVVKKVRKSINQFKTSIKSFTHALPITNIDILIFPIAKNLTKWWWIVVK